MKSNINIQDEILNAAGSAMAREIDFGILCGFLIEIGWRKIILNPMTTETSQAIDQWTEQNVKGNFETMGLVWIFEQEQDANWFALRWL